MKNYALLIDADNISDKYMKLIFSKISEKHNITYRRIYGDFTKASLSSWKNVILDYSLTPMQQYNYTTGKNSTDSAMIIDAMDILYSERVEGFYIVSSDSDFTKLATRLRESGMDVVGLGERKTPQSFILACRKFRYLDSIKQTPSTAKEMKKVVEEVASTNEFDINAEIDSLNNIIIGIIEKGADESGQFEVSKLGQAIHDNISNFSIKTYGYKKLIDYLQAQNLFEFLYTLGENGAKSYVISLKRGTDYGDKSSDI